MPNGWPCLKHREEFVVSSLLILSYYIIKLFHRAGGNGPRALPATCCERTRNALRPHTEPVASTVATGRKQGPTWRCVSGERVGGVSVPHFEPSLREGGNFPHGAWPRSTKPGPYKHIIWSFSCDSVLRLIPFHVTVLRKPSAYVCRSAGWPGGTCSCRPSPLSATASRCVRPVPSVPRTGRCRAARCRVRPHRPGH